MMIAMTCGFCILLSGGLLMASRVINALGVRAGRDKTTVRTPLGEFRLEKAKEVGPGLPVYPAATLVLAGAATTHLPLNDDQPQVLTSTYHTNASREYVANWYLEHLSPEFARRDSGPKKLPKALRDAHISDDDIAFVGERGDQIRVVALTLDEMGTKITLLRSYTQPPSTAPAQPPAQ
ncbi:MAG: hypothetical protein AUF67_07195 [Acidobacteria bacterium 13_1_20CM_58_21]|nr:MAG: hypothetical protein AUF67_07195 [Acidobacteria bacterium 13_1_20CM_58_21]